MRNPEYFSSGIECIFSLIRILEYFKRDIYVWNGFIP